MQIPPSIYGLYGEVNSRLRHDIVRLKRVEDWNALIEADGMVDAARVPGLFVLNGPSPLLSDEPQFHCFLPLTILLKLVDTGRLPSQFEQGVFESSLGTPWGTLGLLAPANRIWLFPEDRHLPLFRAACQFWHTLDAEGARYTVGSTTGAPLWSVGSNLKYVLANLGVPTSVLNAPLPPDGPASLLPSQ